MTPKKIKPLKKTSKTRSKTGLSAKKREIQKNLNTQIIAKEVFYYENVTSTNDVAKQKILSGKIKEGTIFISDTQTHGRGRGDKKWYSPHGGLWFSVVLQPNIPPDKTMLVTMTVSTAVSEGIEKITMLKPRIKWPNDILINGKKTCGVLTEVDTIKNEMKVIVGIGINVNNTLTKKLRKNATTLKKEAGSDIPKTKLLRVILKNLDINYDLLLSKNLEVIRKKWLKYSDIIGKKILVKNNNHQIKGVVVNVDTQGALMLKTDDTIKKILRGDIKYL